MWGGGLEQAVVTADPSPYLFLCDVCEAVLEKNLGSGYKPQVPLAPPILTFCLSALGMTER